MADNTCTATFEGLPLRGAVLSLTRGVEPSQFTLYMPPQDGLDISDGTLTYDMDGNGVSLGGCCLDTAFVRQKPDGEWPLWAVHGFDRRWQWAGKTIGGDYNRRLSDGTVDPATRKTPGELATLCLQALGEGSADTSQMPTGVWPRFQVANAEARWVLAWLCDYVGCEVVLNPQTGAVEIWPLGSGASSPDEGGILPKYRFVPRANVPGTVQVLGGDSVWQGRLKLQCALRQYSTGQQQLLANWADKPSDVSVESPFSFPSQTDANKRAIEYEAYFREFHLSGQQDGTLQVPNCPFPVQSVDQYLLNDYLLETETDVAGFKRNLPCYLDGNYYAWTDLPNNTSSARYTGSFQLQAERRIVKTPYPVFKLSSSGAYQEPDLYVTTSYRLRTLQGQTIGLYRSGSTGGSGGTLTLRRPEVFSIYSTSTTPGAQTNTESQAIAELDQYVAIFQRKFANPSASEICLPGLRPFTLDGNIAQVTWRWFINRGHETSTTVCEQEELDVAAAAPRERRRRRELARLVEAAR